MLYVNHTQYVPDIENWYGNWYGNGYGNRNGAIKNHAFYTREYLYPQPTIHFMLTNIGCFFLIYLVDKLLKKVNCSSRWFTLHALTNFIIAATTFSDVILCIKNPVVSSFPAIYYIAGNIAFSLHIYHCVFFKIRLDDWLHHILSCFIFAPTCIKFSSKGLSVFYFFCTGLPGAIDYTVLTHVKAGRIVKKQQKKISSFINAYIRMPGGVFCAGLLFKDGLHLFSTTFYGLELIILSFMVYINSCFYGKQSMENYGMYKQMKT